MAEDDSWTTLFYKGLGYEDLDGDGDVDSNDYYASGGAQDYDGDGDIDWYDAANHSRRSGMEALGFQDQDDDGAYIDPDEDLPDLPDVEVPWYVKLGFTGAAATPLALGAAGVASTVALYKSGVYKEVAKGVNKAVRKLL